jgi:hypothetical protein
MVGSAAWMGGAHGARAMADPGGRPGEVECVSFKDIGLVKV